VHVATVRRMHVLAAAVVALALLPPAPAVPEQPSRALGKPYHGRLVDGVQLPAAGDAFFTWDWGTRTSPNRAWRRWATDKTVATTLTVLADYRAAHPGAPRVGVADLSRPHGGVFDRRYGGDGHASHQNGLDVDVLYPRKDGLEKPALRPAQVDRALAQDLVDRFAAAGAQYLFVGPRSGLHGPKGVVEAIPNHEDHVHVRLRR
jgi:murein endopeptidase